MGEAVAVAVRDEDAGDDRRVEGVETAVGVALAGGHRRAQVEALAEDRGDLELERRSFGQLREPAAHDVADRRRARSRSSATPRSPASRASSATNSGLPPARSLHPLGDLVGRRDTRRELHQSGDVARCRAATSTRVVVGTDRRRSPSARRGSTRARSPAGGGRRRRGPAACASRSSTSRRTSSVAGSAQCRSSSNDQPRRAGELVERGRRSDRPSRRGERHAACPDPPTRADATGWQPWQPRRRRCRRPSTGRSRCTATTTAPARARRQRPTAVRHPSAAGMSQEGVAQRRLADAGLALEQHEPGRPRRGRVERSDECAPFLGVGPTSSPRRPAAAVRQSTGVVATGELGASDQRRVLGEDPPFQLAKLGPGVEPELVEQHERARRQRPQGVGLAAAAVEREREQRPQPLAQRLLVDGHLQPGDRLGVAAEGEQRVEAVLDRRLTLLVELGDDRPDLILGADAGERRPTPEGERRVEAAASACAVLARSRGCPAVGWRARRNRCTSMCSAGTCKHVAGRLRHEHLRGRAGAAGRLDRRGAAATRSSAACPSGVRGGCSPHRRSISRSTDTTRPASSARWAMTARCCGPPSSSASPSRRTSTGPSTCTVNTPAGL